MRTSLPNHVVQLGVAAAAIAVLGLVCPSIGQEVPLTPGSAVEPANRDGEWVQMDVEPRPSGGSGVWVGPVNEPAWEFMEGFTIPDVPPLVQSDPEPPSAPLTPPPFQGFEGVDATGAGVVPPDTHIAVGPHPGTHGRVMMVTNGDVQIWDKYGNSVAGPTALDTMFSNNVFDPKVLYDQHSGRFFIVCLEGTSTAFSQVHIAVSDDAVPDDLTSEWTFSEGSGIVDIGGALTWADYPSIGADSAGLFVTTNQFTSTDPVVFLGSAIWVFDKADLFAGVYNPQMGVAPGIFTLQPAHVYGATDNGGFYLVSRIWRYQYVIMNITGHPGPITVTASFNPWDTGWTMGVAAAQAGTPVRLDTLASRVMNAVYRDGHIWLCLTADPDEDLRTEVVWQDIATNGSPAAAAVAQGGFINGTGTDPWTYMPSINVSAAGDAAICYTQSAETEFPGVYYVSRLAGDPPNTFQTPVAALPGPGYYHSFAVAACVDHSDCDPGVLCAPWGYCLRRDRWGDYSGCVVDPTSDCFWVANEYAFTSAPATSLWGTYIASFCTRNEPPIAQCVDPFTRNADDECCIYITAADIDNGSFDPEDEVETICITLIDGVRVPCDPNAVHQICGTGDHTVELTITDEGGLFDYCETTVTIVDVTPPTIVCGITNNDDPVLMDPNCEATVTYAATISDNCCLDPNDVSVDAVDLTGNAISVGTPTAVITWLADRSLLVTGSVLVSGLTACPVTIEITIEASDCSDNPAEPCVDTRDVEDQTPPTITCPDDIFVEHGDFECNDEVLDWLNSATAEDNCDPDPNIVNDAPPCGFAPGTTTEVTWTATDNCGNSDPNDSQCSAFITVAPAGRAQTSVKGSVLVFPKIELRWDGPDPATATLLQETFITLTNDFEEGVRVHLYHISGDNCIARNNTLDLTNNHPLWWAASTGAPGPFNHPLWPFTGLGVPILDPDTGEYYLRGFVVAFAVNPTGNEIRWNHLWGRATIVRYDDAAAWEYPAMTFRASTCVEQGEEPRDCLLFDANGACCDSDVVPGNLDFDGFQYDFAPATLMFTFMGSGSTAYSVPGQSFIHDSDLTLCFLDHDLRVEAADPPPITLASFLVWNENETIFSGMKRCLTCWDQTLLSIYAGAFERTYLQTDQGYARLNGVESSYHCVDSVERALIGVIARVMEHNGTLVMSGKTLVGSGTESANLRYDTQAAGEEK